MRIHTLRALKDNFIFVLEGGREAAVIDPGEAEPVAVYLDSHKLSLKNILCTHHHLDHTGGAQTLAQRLGASIACSPTDLERIQGAKTPLIEGQVYSICGEQMQVLATPGHTAGQVAFWFPKVEAAFVGDTLFSAGCGRLFEGTHAEMWHSLNKLKALPPETRLYFGHEYTMRNLEFLKGYEWNTPLVADYFDKCQRKIHNGEMTVPSTIGLECQINPFLAAKSLQEFKTWRDRRDAW